MTAVVFDCEKMRMLNCGLGQFSLHLGRALLAEAPEGWELVLFLRRNRDALFPTHPPRRIYVYPWKKEQVYRYLRPWLKLPSRRPAFDLWHVTNQLSKYLPLDPRIPVVLTIHDLSFLREGVPERSERELRRLQRLVDRACIVTTGAQFVAAEIRQHLELAGRDLVVIPDGVCLSVGNRKQRPEGLPEGRFLFTIGNAAPHKNFHVLLDLLPHLPDFRLVIAGRKTTEYGAFLERRVVELGLEGRVSLLGEVSDAERQWLYEACEALLFPSLSEGFGLPVLEAMHCGRPVFLSRNTSLPEVGGPLGFYWDSYEPQAMLDVFRQGLATFARDPQYSQNLREHAASFSWTSTARGYLRVYETALQKR